MYVAKINNLLKHHGAVPLEARGPMQLHGCIGLRPSLAEMVVYKTLWKFLVPICIGKMRV